MRIHFVLAALVASTLSAKAAAFDCAAAHSGIDKAICASPALKSADEAMVAAYKAARHGASGAAREAILASQRVWIRRRGAACDSSDAHYIACLMAETEARRRFLAGQAESGPGLDSPMRPLILMRAGRKGSLYAANVELLEFTDPQTPAEKTFNADVAKVLAGVPKAADDLAHGQMAAYDLAMQVTFASPKLISARLDGLVDAGGAYPNSASWAINIDAANGRNLAFADAFDPAAHERLTADCMAEIIPQKKQRGLDLQPGEELSALRKNVDKAVGDLAGWSFSATGATVTFVGDPLTGNHSYDVGVHAEGDYSCTFPLSRLRVLAKRGFPLPD